MCKDHFSMRKQKIKILDIYLLSFLLFIIFCCLPASIPMIINDLQLQSFSKNLYNYTLPEQTKIIDRYREVSVKGNGNHCDFFVEQTLQTNLEYQAIKNYYSNIKFPPVRNEPQGWEDINSSGVHTLVIPDIVFLGKDEKGYMLYKVSIKDVGYPPGFDYRCH
jgi:hypothetical protein